MKSPLSLLNTRNSVLLVSALLGANCSTFAATDTWSSTPAGVNWNSTDWTGGNAPPQAGDSLVFGSSSQTTLNNNFPALTAFDGLTFSGGNAFTLNGNSVLLSGSMTANGIGVLNNSGVAQTLGTLPLVLDNGNYTFSTTAGGSVALNGGMTLNPGGVAFFDGNNTSTALTLDGTSGLITGLEGAAFIYDGTFIPLGLATISGGSIVTYSGYTPVASGAIGNGNNLNLTANGVSATYTANNNTVNSISAAQTGNAGGTLTSTLNNTGTLTLGANGGIYLLGGTFGSKACLSLAGGNLTAGASGPATIVFAVNGNNPNNQASVSSTIKNNASGGAVSVVKTGPGSMNFATTTTSTYSGGVYVNEGQLQFGQVQQLGIGPVYVASGASLYFTGTGTLTNDFYLSPGVGAGASSAVLNGGSLFFAGSGVETFLGTIHLPGAPVSVGTAGNRISGNLSAAQTAVFAGQITGTGTLDFYVNPHAGNFVLSNATVNLNNWQGGMLIEEVLAAPSSARNVIVKLGANNQIPNGANAGDVTLSSADVSAFHSIVRLDLNGFNATVNGLNGVSAGFPVSVGDFATANSILTVGANNASATFNGVMDDGHVAGKTLSLVKIGAGTQTLSGVNTYVGSTTISNGTLALSGSGSISTSAAITIAAPGTLDASAASGGGLTVASAQTVNGLGTIDGSTIVNGAINPSFGTIGTLSNNGNVAFNGGGSYVWNMNNANGTAGTDPGWSLLNLTGGGTLTINANSGNPFIIKITSLTAGDLPGNAANFNASVTKSWVIAQSTVPISGFAASAFTLNTSTFSNPTGSGSFSIGLSLDQKSLLLTFTATPAISTPLVSQTNNAGSSAVFTVVANGATIPVSFQWLQGSNPLSNGGTSASGGAVTITSSGHTSTLSIANVQDADAGGFTVNVSDGSGDTGTSSATLTVIDPPSGLSVAQSATQSTSPNYVNAAAGGIITLTASASGTGPLTYVWSLNGTPVATNTTGIYNVNVSHATVGTYTVVVSNPAGSLSNNSTVIAPVTQSASQIVYEPFNYAVQAAGAAPWTAFGVTNIFNQATGLGLSWLNSGTAVQPATLAQDMRIEPGFDNPTDSPNGDSYPWPGLAGNSPQEVYCNVNSFMRLPLGTGGSISSGTVYFSMIVHADQGAPIGAVGTDYLCGFGTGSSTTPNTAIYIKTPGDDSYLPGIFKTSAGTGGLLPGVNGDWSGKAYHRGQIVFVIARLTINPGATNDTFDLWLAPATNSFGAGEVNLPAPDVTGVGSNAADVGNVDYFFIRNGAQPFSRRFTDLRIGTTWASVTPPSAPTLSLANQSVGLGSTAFFASENAGNPATSYSWSFNGGPALTDGSHFAGTSTDTLMITNVQAGDVGTYTVTAMNQDPLTLATLTGTASATLSISTPLLKVAAITPTQVVLSWPTNFGSYTLEQSPAVAPTTWTTNSAPPYSTVGTNYVVTNTISGTKFFRLIQ